MPRLHDVTNIFLINLDYCNNERSLVAERIYENKYLHRDRYTYPLII